MLEPERVADQEGRNSAKGLVHRLIALEQRMRSRVWRTTQKIEIQNDDNGLELSIVLIQAVSNNKI